MTNEQARDFARWVAGARVVIGATAILAPTLVTRPWLGRDIGRHTDKLLARSLGSRDIALGMGAIMAMDRGAPSRGWLEAGGLADAGDLLGTLLAFRSLPRLSRWTMLLAISGAVAAAGVLAPAVDRAEDRSGADV
ncbi:MAG TPA: hypothetical protein VF005_03235 [Acidimicrobiales bacterium]